MLSLNRLSLRRSWSVLLALVLSVAQAAAQAPAARPTLDNIRSTGVITLAHRESSVPFSYYDDSKRPIGYSIDLCLLVVEALRRELKLSKLRVEYLPVTPADRIQAIAGGKADLECGNTTNTLERRRSVAFTVVHFFAGGRLLIRAGGPTSLADLHLRRGTVVTTKGSTYAKFLESKAKLGSFNVRVTEAKDAAEAFALFERGEADAFLFDDIVLYGLRAAAKSPSAYEVSSELLSMEPLAIMLRKDDPAFKRFVDTTLTRAMIDGEVRPLYRKWFQSPIPPKGVNLNVPVSPLLFDQFRYPSDNVGDETPWLKK